jgi:hypothetical protein
MWQARPLPNLKETELALKAEIGARASGFAKLIFPSDTNASAPLDMKSSGRKRTPAPWTSTNSETERIIDLSELSDDSSSAPEPQVFPHLSSAYIPCMTVGHWV